MDPFEEEPISRRRGALGYIFSRLEKLKVPKRASKQHSGTHPSSPPEEVCADAIHCQVCETIAQAATHSFAGEFNHWLHLGSWRDFLSRVDCITCQKIVRYFELERHGPTAISESCLLIGTQTSSSGGFDYFDISCMYSGIELDKKEHDHGQLRLIPSKDLAPNDAHYISLDPQIINITRLQHWLAQCEAEHGEECHKIGVQFSRYVSSLTLIDVQKSCLVISEVPDRYVALSYVWGNIPETLMATRQNLRYLCTPGSLEEPETITKTPRTILDAIALTRMMGVNYLWVDRLCIVQDDDEHLNEQLQQMTSIYQNSYFTIIAAEGQDANYGLRGIGGQALPRVYKQSIYDFALKAKFLLQPHHESETSVSTWYTRAWTFQERAVSRKTVVFVNGTVYWQCRSMTCYEDTMAHSAGASSEWPSYALTIQPWPDLKQYFSFVRGYNSRCLSYESDALKAFTAILGAFNGTFPTGFLFGIPEAFFDLGLLWSTSRPLKRRKDFPSWSWVGWSGEIKFDMYTCWDPRFGNHNWVTPVIAWEKVREEDQSYVRIDNSYRLYCHMGEESTPELPKDWRRTSYGYFLHPLLQTPFKYPFPSDLRRPGPETWSRLLPFRAKKCAMSLGRSWKYPRDDASGSETCLVVELDDGSGRHTGVIESLFTSDLEYSRGDQCQLIAISRACATAALHSEERRKGLFKEVDIFPELENKRWYHFYNILWVEWEGEVAYRRALGRIMKDAWERQDLQEVDVILG